MHWACAGWYSWWYENLYMIIKSFLKKSVLQWVKVTVKQSFQNKSLPIKNCNSLKLHQCIVCWISVQICLGKLHRSSITHMTYRKWEDICSKCNFFSFFSLFSPKNTWLTIERLKKALHYKQSKQVLIDFLVILLLEYPCYI